MQINYLAVVVAAVAGFLLGWGWYSVFGKVWMAGLGKKQRRLRQGHADRSRWSSPRSPVSSWPICSPG